LGVFGRPLRHWVTGVIGTPQLCERAMVGVFSRWQRMVLAMLALSVLYWVARPKEESLRRVLPGAMRPRRCSGGW